jgi:hypothetical protein
MDTVFGLDVEPEVPLSFLAGATAGPTGRRLELAVRAEDTARRDWPESTELACDERRHDGSEGFRIETHPDAGYLISEPGYGSYLLSPNGRRLRCFPEGHPGDAWQRLLIAQVLPFAALLHGLEVLHASAVVHHRGVVAFVGPSRAGKTSLALELCRRGADFVADDVLALERTDEGVLLGHPGAPLAGLDHDEARRLERSEDAARQLEGSGDVRRSTGSAAAARGSEIVAVNTRERLVRVRGAAEPLPLSALFFLDRRDGGPARPCFEPAADARLLLAATFNFVLATRERLRGLLEVCALAARLRVERIVVGPTTDASQLAGAIERRLSS